MLFRSEDENTACHWQTEAHRHYPVNLNVIRYVVLEQRTWVIDAVYFHILFYARKRGLEKNSLNTKNVVRMLMFRSMFLQSYILSNMTLL